MSPLPPLAIAVPMVAAALTAVGGKRVPRALLAVMNLAASAFATVACAILAHDAAVHGTVVHWFGAWRPGHGIALGIAFVVDPAAAALAAFVGFLTCAAFVFAWTYYEQDDGGFSALMQVFSAALIGFFLTGDLFNMFVFFELMSVSAYALTGFRSEDSSAVVGALEFGAINSIGAFLVLIGITLVYARTGGLSMAQIGHALGAAASDPLVSVAFALIVAGFLVKAAIVPFHFWLGEAHAVAPSPLCLLFSGIMVQAGLYAVARTYWSVFSGALAPHGEGLRNVLLAFGLLTAVVGALMCYAQRHLKRLLAFSTVAHSGIMLCAIALLSPLALGGFFIYVLAHGLVKGGLFLGSGIILNRYATVDVENLRGRLRDLPWLAVAFALGAFALAGLPPFGIFTATVLLDEGLGRDGAGWAGIVLMLAAALTGGSILNAVGRMTFGWGPPPDPRAVSPGREEPETEPARGIELTVMAAPALVLLLTAVALGAFGGIAPVAVAAAERFIDRVQQEAIVLHGAGPVPLAVVGGISTSSAITRGCLSALIALAFAALGLHAHRLRRIWPVLARAYTAAMRIPHAWHGGIVTDDVAWLVVGGAAFGAAILVVGR